MSAEDNSTSANTDQSSPDEIEIRINNLFRQVTNLDLMNQLKQAIIEYRNSRK
ncbi:MAG: hypothetical protein ACE5EH_01975 [Gammaproteobacteria bacterium]